MSIYLAYKLFEKKIVLAFTIMFILLGIFFNHTLEKNSFIFPVLDGGTVEILEDGYITKYFDGSGSFKAINKDIKDKDHRDGYPVNLPFIKVKKGEVLRVQGVVVESPDFGLNISLVTEKGQITKYNYDKNSNVATVENLVKINKDVENIFFKHFGDLMYGPLLIPISVTYLSHIMGD
jgi:hypothetical protein